MKCGAQKVLTVGENPGEWHAEANPHERCLFAITAQGLHDHSVEDRDGEIYSGKHKCCENNLSRLYQSELC